VSYFLGLIRFPSRENRTTTRMGGVKQSILDRIEGDFTE
jgi:hypothetical protein